MDMNYTLIKINCAMQERLICLDILRALVGNRNAGCKFTILKSLEMQSLYLNIQIFIVFSELSSLEGLDLLFYVMLFVSIE